MKTPVVLLMFKRPDTTKQVFEVIRKVQPKQLFVIADGPRADKADEAELCAETRAVVEQVDWECEVHKNYAETNMGLRERVASGLSWVFEQVEDAIILEDDCVPDPTFFQFCQDCLDKYRDDKRIMMVCGTNLLGEWKSDIQSYCFSYHSHCWGWATWRRAWEYYDPDMSLWSKPEIRDRIRDVVCDKNRFLKYEKLFNRVHSGEINSWALRWLCSRLAQSGLSIIPANNLITNIGFTETATNTSSIDSRAYLATHSVKFPLTSPLGVARDRGYEQACFKQHQPNSISNRIMRKIVQIFKKII